MSNLIKNNYISKTWFYIIDDNSPSVIDIQENIYVSLLVINTKKPITINIESNSKVEFFGFFYDSCPSKILINQLNDWSSLNFKSLFFNEKNDLSCTIKSYVSSNNSSSNLDIIWMVEDKKLSIDSTIEIENWYSWIDAHLDIENIFIWEGGSIKSLPVLLVRSDDIKASHSSKTHKISENKKFYLKSRWLTEKEANFMLLESYFVKIFRCVWMIDKIMYEKLNGDFVGFLK
jgi:hypothetical protein